MEFSEFELGQMLAATVDCGHVQMGSPAHGVALKVIAEGAEANRSPSQHTAYDLHVSPHLRKTAAEAEVEDRRSRWPDQTTPVFTSGGHSILVVRPLLNAVL
jgi:hypothetical protein